MRLPIGRVCVAPIAIILREWKLPLADANIRGRLLDLASFLIKPVNL